MRIERLSGSFRKIFARSYSTRHMLPELDPVLRAPDLSEMIVPGRSSNDGCGPAARAPSSPARDGRVAWARRPGRAQGAGPAARTGALHPTVDAGRAQGLTSAEKGESVEFDARAGCWRWKSRSTCTSGYFDRRASCQNRAPAGPPARRRRSAPQLSPRLSQPGRVREPAPPQPRRHDHQRVCALETGSTSAPG